MELFHKITRVQMIKKSKENNFSRVETDYYFKSQDIKYIEVLPEDFLISSTNNDSKAKYKVFIPENLVKIGGNGTPYTTFFYTHELPDGLIAKEL